ncbi:MAG: T9SS type A sorting domain-containing protein [Candidatus Zixiibacteriota bacterium]
MKKAIILIILAMISYGDWIFGPEGFDDASAIVTSSYGYDDYWFAPDYNDPMYVYSPGFESDSCIGSGEMSWADWWSNFIRTPITDCSDADSVILSFRMWNTGDPSDYDFARFYIWVEPDGYMGTVEKSMGFGHDREWELMNIDFTEFAAGESEVYFYLEANFGTGSFERECRFDDIGIRTASFLDIQEKAAPKDELKLIVSPNPFKNATNVKRAEYASEINIYDIKGNLIESLPENREIWIPKKSLNTGTYLIEARAKDGKSVNAIAIYMK